MNKAEEILSAEFWIMKTYPNFKQSYVISFEMMNAYADYVHQSRVNAEYELFKELYLTFINTCDSVFVGDTKIIDLIKRCDKLLKQ